MTTTTATRLVYTPNPVTCEGQANLAAELLPGERLGDFLRRVAPDTRTGEWIAAIGGRTVPTHLWDRVSPKHGQVIEVRAKVGKQALYIVAMIALTYWTMGAASALGTAGGTVFGLSGAAGMMAVVGVQIAGPAIGGKVIR